MIVAKDGSGDYTSISGAVSAAVPGDKIFVKPGIYNERVAPFVTLLTGDEANRQISFFDEIIAAFHE